MFNTSSLICMRPYTISIEGQGRTVTLVFKADFVYIDLISVVSTNFFSFSIKLAIDHWPICSLECACFPEILTFFTLTYTNLEFRHHRKWSLNRQFQCKSIKNYRAKTPQNLALNKHFVQIPEKQAHSRVSIYRATVGFRFLKFPGAKLGLMDRRKGLEQTGARFLDIIF